MTNKKCKIDKEYSKLPREKGPIPKPGRRSSTMAPMAVPSQRRRGLCNILGEREFGFRLGMTTMMMDSVTCAKQTHRCWMFKYSKQRLRCELLLPLCARKWRNVEEPSGPAFLFSPSSSFLIKICFFFCYNKNLFFFSDKDGFICFPFFFNN